MSNLSFFKWFISMSLYLLFFSCSNAQNNTLPTPQIQDGVAKLSGKITNFHPNVSEDNGTLTLRVVQPVTAEVCQVITTVNEDDYFTFEVPMQCNYAIGYILPGKGSYDAFDVCLTSGKEVTIDILYEETTGRLKSIHQADSLGLTSTDLINMSSVARKLTNYGSLGGSGYVKTPDEFVQQLRIKLDKQLNLIAENKAASEYVRNIILSDNAKTILTNGIKILLLDWVLFDYKRVMQLGYLNAGNKDVENYNPPEPDKKYYEFLKDFDLNNPLYLYNGNYFEVLQKILSNDTLNIPPIGDTPVDQWMKTVKNRLSELVGFDKGLFYDMLAANSYASQFNNELRPLSDTQKENINTYFKDDKAEFAKILLKKNDEIIQLAAQKEPLVVNKTPAAPKEKLMNAIIAKYKGKVVVVDFWATWCAPCLDAMEKYRTVKHALRGKNVVFVYLTNTTSPKKLWEEKIKGIGGEHYYLNNDEWKYIFDTFGLEYIPSYLFFDTNGKFAQKIVSYPGNEEMKKMIEKLLP